MCATRCTAIAASSLLTRHNSRHMALRVAGQAVRSLASSRRPCTPATTAAAVGAARQIHNTTAAFDAPTLAQHRDTPDNTEETFFDFTPENYARVEKIMAKYPANYRQAGMIPLLDLAQRQHGGWLPLAAMNKVAKIIEQEPMKVYEVATFYTMFNREKRGKHFIQLCGTTPCMVCGSEEIKKTITEELGIGNGETTKDEMFTLLEVECLGACANAPMVQLNDDYYECLTPALMKDLLKACKEDRAPEMGRWGSLPMNGQVSCEGPAGKTSLKEKPTGPGFMMRDDLEQKVDPSSVKEHMHY